MTNKQDVFSIQLALFEALGAHDRDPVELFGRPMRMTPSSLAFCRAAMDQFEELSSSDDEVEMVVGLRVTKKGTAKKQLDKLPPLSIRVAKDGEIVRTIEIDDPRKSFCQLWNEVHKDMEAYVLADDD